MNRKGRRDFHGEDPPDWEEYLVLLADTSEPNYLGLLLPLHRKCLPCQLQYDAVIKMESFQEDFRFVSCLQTNSDGFNSEKSSILVE